MDAYQTIPTAGMHPVYKGNRGCLTDDCTRYDDCHWGIPCEIGWIVPSPYLEIKIEEYYD